MRTRSPLRIADQNYEAAADAWVAAVVGAGGTVSNHQHNSVAQLIRSLKWYGVWSLLDRLWMFAAENSTQALIDIKALATATTVNSPTFTANRGYQGDGTSARINTGFNASTAGGNYARDNAHFSFWVETAETLSGTRSYMGNDFNNYGLVAHAVSDMFGGINSAGFITAALPSPETGHWLAQRTASNAQAIYKDAALFGSSGAASLALVNASFLVLAVPTSSFSSGRVASASLGASLSAAQLAAFRAAQRAYMTSVGVA